MKLMRMLEEDLMSVKKNTILPIWTKDMEILMTEFQMTKTIMTIETSVARNMETPKTTPLLMKTLAQATTKEREVFYQE